MKKDYIVSEELEHHVRQLALPPTASCRFLSLVLDGGTAGSYVGQKLVSTCKRDARRAVRGCVEAKLVIKDKEHIPGVRSAHYIPTELTLQLELSNSYYRTQLYEGPCRQYPEFSKVNLAYAFKSNKGLCQFLANGTGLKYDHIALIDKLKKLQQIPEHAKIAMRQFGRYPVGAEIVPALIRQTRSDHRLWQKQPCPQNIKRDVRSLMFRPMATSAVLVNPDFKSAEINILRCLIGQPLLEDAYEGLFDRHERKEKKQLAQMLLAGCSLPCINRHCLEDGLSQVTQDEYDQTIDQLGGAKYKDLIKHQKKAKHRIQTTLKRTVAKISIPAHKEIGRLTLPRCKTGIHLHDGFIVPLDPRFMKGDSAPKVMQVYHAQSKRVLGCELPVSLSLVNQQ
jgi:hypothetical protein